MRTISTTLAWASITLLAGVGTGLADAPPETPGGRLTLRIVGLEAEGGDVAVALFDSAEAYESRDPAVRKAFLSTAGGTVREWTVDGLAPGTYAAMAYQDTNGNRALDRRKIGLPKEPYGFTNDARAVFGPPSFEAAAFFFEGGDETVEIRLRGGRRALGKVGKTGDEESGESS